MKVRSEDDPLAGGGIRNRGVLIAVFPIMNDGTDGSWRESCGYEECQY